MRMGDGVCDFFKSGTGRGTGIFRVPNMVRITERVREVSEVPSTGTNFRHNV